MKLFCD